MKNSSLRFACSFLLSLSCALVASATPIVVMKTKTGYIVATNGLRKGGDRVCKLQYNSSEVTLHSAPTSKVWAPNGQVLFDMNDVIWALYADTSTYVTTSAIAISLDREIAKRAYELREKPQYQFELVNVTARGVYAAAIAVLMSNPLNWQKDTSDVFSKPFDLKEGEALVWILTQYPERRTGEPTVAGVTKLLNNAIPRGQEEDLGPPYLIGEIDKQGFRFLSSDVSICTATHPTPALVPSTLR